MLLPVVKLIVELLRAFHMPPVSVVPESWATELFTVRVPLTSAVPVLFKLPLTIKLHPVPAVNVPELAKSPAVVKFRPLRTLKFPWLFAN